MSSSLKPRTVGGYEVLDLLGRGGMGTVYKARHVHDGRVVALKVASRMVMDDPILSKRFAREHSIAAGLDHPNLIRVHSHGVEAGFETGVDGDDVFLVMEFVDGVNLHEKLRRSGKMSLDEARPLFRQLCDVLSYLHAKNIIHRDIKPANLIIDDAGVLKLADLGLLKSDACVDLITHSQVGLGTVDFASPEQFDDAKNVDARCDIYALAATLYVTLSGRQPFGGGGPMQVLSRKLGYQFAPLGEVVTGIPPAIDRLVNRCLHPDPAVRPSSVLEFRDILERAESLIDTVREDDKPEVRPVSPEPEPEVNEPRRKQHRYIVNVPIQFESMGRISSPRSEATIVDISQGGVCLRFGRYTASGSILKVWLPGETREDEETLLVRVAWNKSLRSSTYHAGCAFLRPLESQQLERLLRHESGNTRVLEVT